jgi:Cu/Ag efflux pump CusA
LKWLILAQCGQTAISTSGLKMLNSIVKWLIGQRWLVAIAAIIIILWGIGVLMQMPLNVLPVFAPPQVKIPRFITSN